jgi:uncharacterized repeat protein (TIGR01451 family)
VLLVTALVGIIGSPPAAAVEQSALIDFESGLSEGDTPDILFVGRGISGADLGTVTLVGFNPDVPGNSAMIYDATCGGQTAPPGDPAYDPALCSDDDSDLYVPAAGNIAIISEDGNAEVPDDALRGDTFWTLDFTDWGPGEVTVDSFGVADVDFGQTGAEASFFDGDGGLLAVIPIPEIGDNAATIVPAGVAGVASMTVTLNGSGAIDLISITVDEPLIDVELTKTVEPAAVAIGTETTFSISLVNQGPDAATGVVVEDRLPDGLTYVSHSGDGSFDPATGEWTIGDAAVGEIFALDLVVTVDEAGEFTNVAEVMEHNEKDVDSTPGNNVPEEDDQDTAIVVASPLIDVELDKSVAPAAVRVGDATTFTVVVRNEGPQDATGVVVEDRLPAGLTYVSHSGDGSFDPATFIWTIGDLAAGESVSMDFVVTVDEVGSFTNVAEVIEHNEEDVDSTPGNNVPEEDDQDLAIVTATDEPLIDVELTKSVDSETVEVGENATFTVLVENKGPDDATGVVVEDRLPAGLTYVSHSGDGSFDPATFIWTIGDLAVGESVTLDFVVTVDDIGIFTNVAEVMDHNEEDVDSTPGNNVPEEDDQDLATVTATAIVEASSTIGDYVWFDDNKDGVQDPNEDGVPGVTVRLTNQATNEVSTQVTNADGLYLFSALDAGTYFVEVLQSTFPDNHSLTTVGSYTVTVQDDESFLDADFGIVEVLPITGMEIGTFAAIGLILLALGGLLLGWEQRRRLALEHAA